MLGNCKDSCTSCQQSAATCFLALEYVCIYYLCIHAYVCCVFVCVSSVYLNIPFLIVMNVLISLVGLIIYAYYADVGCDPLRSKLISSSNQVCRASVSDTFLLPPPRRLCFLSGLSLCLRVCLSVCKLFQIGCELIWITFLEGWGMAQWTVNYILVTVQITFPYFAPIFDPCNAFSVGRQ